MSTVINGSSPSITFSDGTTQYSASGSGITTVTLSSATPNATLTSASNQYIRVVLDTTTPYAPSITLPNMTTLSTGVGRFVVSNELGIPLAVKDNGGTVREYLPPFSSWAINITSVATSNGVWYFNNSPTLIGDAPILSASILPTTYMVGANPTIYGLKLFLVVKLDSTNFAFVWSENDAFQRGIGLYAKLYTVNTSTGVFTAGNRITLTSAGYWDTLAYDTDNAGHALVVYGGGGDIKSFGLSVSGGTLYASAVNSVGTVAGSTGQVWCAYLGNNSAYAYGGTGSRDACCALTGGTVVRGGTVTGTTTVTYTQSASNTSWNSGGFYPSYGRTSLTTFTSIYYDSGTLAYALGKYITYTPSTNTFTLAARTSTTTPLDIETFNGTNTSSMSFAQGGYAYSSTKAMQGGVVFDVTNTGAAGVTAVYSVSYATKPLISTNYFTVTSGVSPVTYPVTSFLNSSTQTYTICIPQITAQYLYTSGSITVPRLAISDPTSSTLNLGISGSPQAPWGSAYMYPKNQFIYTGAIILSSSFGVFNANSTGAGSGIVQIQCVPLATSIV